MRPKPKRGVAMPTGAIAGDAWVDQLRADLTSEIEGRDLILARVVLQDGAFTHEERIIQALLRLLDHERGSVRVLGGIATNWRAFPKSTKPTPRKGRK